ncbi:hypothetical protein C2W62_49445 [Candidatus Entotheonella serta]|nr:hypothetical protein C2W62_49445 [Candidatus Entotheonella serta]
MLRRHIEAFDGFVSGANSILEARQHELGITAEGKRLLKENTEVTRALTTAVNQLVSEAKLDIQTGNAEVTKAQRFGIGVLMAAVTLSLISSTLIVWLYVDRNLIARLTALSDSMLAIAGGNLQARLPEDAVMK